MKSSHGISVRRLSCVRTYYVPAAGVSYVSNALPPDPLQQMLKGNDQHEP